VSAELFLRAATRLIDAYLDEPTAGSRPARLRSIHFPAALDWLRTEDVIRLAAAGHPVGASRKAFFNRWPSREDFLTDAVLYALVDEPVVDDPKDEAAQIPDDVVVAPTFSGEVVRVADGVLQGLRRHPRSYLTLNIGPLLPQNQQLWQALLPSMRRGIIVWAEGCSALMDGLGVTLRPGWTAERLALALQATLDGFLLRYRVQPDDYASASWESASLFADTVVAVIFSAIDPDGGGRDCRAALDDIVEMGS
jgi:AcrR family transcriptional regulator